ncbi:MAG: acyl-CoA synthetase [Desulfobacterales bacterium]
MNTGIHVRRCANLFADRIAVIDGDRRFTFREFNERVNRLANGLLSMGLKKGDRVALLSINRHQLMEGTFACYKSGLVQVPLNARLAIGEIVHMLNNSESSCIIMGREFIEKIEAHSSEIPGLKHYVAMSDGPESMLDYENILQNSSPQEPDVEVEMKDLASLNYTSGTSGTLKAAMLTQRNRLSLSKKSLLSPDNDITKDTVMCHVGPITHASGGMILPVMVRGGCNVLLPGFDIPLLLQTIEKERVTHFFAVPTMLKMLMDYPDLGKYDLSSLKSIRYGAAPMSSDQIAKAIEIFGPILSQGYGQTETSSGITHLSKEDHIVGDDPVKIKRLSSAGLPLFECDVRVVNEKGEEVEPGEVGEIIEQGDDTMAGYWKAPELTAETLINGWVYTRDMGTVDEAGYIYIVDRKSDMIISGGFNIYPSEVENTLCQHPEVSEAAVVPVPDDHWGEAVKAVVVLKEDSKVSGQELIEHCKQRLASYKKPKSVDFVSELPKNPYGKVVRRKIKEQYWKDRERFVH